MHPAGRATAAVMSWTSIWEAKKQVERDKRDHGRWVRRRALLSSRTSNYFCCTLPLLEGGPRLYCTDLGGWDGTGGAQVAHGRLVIKGGRTWVRASQPNGGGGRQTCLSNNESEREKRMRQTDRQTDRQTKGVCVWGGTWASDGANTLRSTQAIKARCLVGCFFPLPRSCTLP